MDELIGLAGAPVVMALVAVLRQAITIPDRYTPLLALALGIVWNVGLRAADMTESTYAVAAVLGILSGLAASGLYSGGKALAGR